jgi:hypothetical protein
MKAAVMKFEFTVVARERQEAFDLLDRTEIAILGSIGGASWVTINDDIQKMHNPMLALCDDQGFYYQGLRTCQFNGPILDTGVQTYHDGHRPQNQVVDGE